MTLQKGMLQIDSANTVHLPNFKNILPFTLYIYIEREIKWERERENERESVCVGESEEREREEETIVWNILSSTAQPRVYIFV